MALLQGWHATDKTRKSFRNDTTGAVLTRRQYDNLAKAVKAAPPSRSEAIKAGIARANERARKIRAEYLAEGLDLNINEIRKTKRYQAERDAAKEAKKSTEIIGQQVAKPAEPIYQPHKVQSVRGKTKQGRGYVIYFVGKQVKDRAEAEQYEPLRPQLNDILQLFQNTPDNGSVVLTVGGILHYTAEDDENVIEYATMKGTAGVMRRVAGRVDSPEAYCKVFLPSTDPEICCYWARTAWGQVQRASNG